ncbi:MAG: hypothetical protein IAI50_07945 [Candidatus Eremiobacteraeota bacterium]|nr:hypothetical protein [Candidatus Eremiobacteraeota bacterium]
MTRGYAERVTVYPGESLTLRVSTTAPRFSIEIYRQGARFEPMADGRFGWYDGAFGPAREAGVAFDWDPYEIRIPPEWPSGAYVAIFVEGSSRDRATTLPDRTTPDARDAKALFVVRGAPDAPAAPVLYKLPLFTYHAYNVPDVAFAGSVREQSDSGEDAQTFYTGTDVVSLQRPGGGTGGTPWDIERAPDAHDRRTPRQTFVHWDAKFIAWLERNGYAVEYCTDLDLHERPSAALARHRVVVSAGHDEYWSDDMRWHLEEFVRGGGNAAFFAGNLLWWRVGVTDKNRSIVRLGHFGDTVDPRGVRAYDESALTGVTFGHGGGHWIGERAPTGFTVCAPEHWSLAGTGLVTGETFGARQRLVGYECDGQSFSWAQAARSGTFAPDGSHRVPAAFETVAFADVRDWQVDGYTGEVLGNGSAIVGSYADGGTVFTAGTTDWARVLDEGNATVDRITRNVLDRLSV